MSVFITFVDILCLVIIWAIIIRAVLSWFNLRPENPLLRILNGITEPILSPLRRIVPRIGMIDITPMVAIILLWLIRVLLYNYS
jgi:YggT family protein